MQNAKSIILKTVNAAVALASAVCTPYILKDHLTNFSLSNSVFSVLIFLGYFFLLNFSLKKIDKKCLIFSYILGFIFSAFMIFGRNIYINGFANITQFKTWALIIVFSPVFCALVNMCFNYLPSISRTSPRKPLSMTDKKRFFIIWCLIFFAWVPVLLASYPGVYGYDSVYQINFYRSGTFNLQHPIAHTYLLGFFVITIGELLGGYEAGMCCYSVFQMLFLSATLSAIYTFYISKKIKNRFSIVILLLFMFLPTNPIMAISATKDILFSAFFALTTMLILILAEHPAHLKSVRFNIALTAGFFFVSIFRSQGKYLVVLILFITLIALWKYKKQLITISLAFIVLLSVYNKSVSMIFNVVPGNSLREMMSVPCMQLSRAAVYNYNELTQEEINSIKSYIGKYEQYNNDAGIADRFKGSLDTEKVKSDPMKFISLWTRVGLKCPSAYIDAFARLTVGYWYPDMNYRDVKAYHPYWEYYPTGVLVPFDETKYLLLKQTPTKGFGMLNKLLASFSYNNSYQKLPVVSILFSSALPLWCALIVFAYKLYKKQYRHLIPVLFVLLFIGTLLLGPVVLYRYVYPLYLVTPLLICFCSSKYEKEV